MSSVRHEQSYHLNFKGQTYRVRFERTANTASFTLPDGQSFDLPTTVLNELAFVCPRICTGQANISRAPEKTELPQKTGQAKRIFQRTGQKWSGDEDQKLSRAFFDAIDFRIIAQNHKRSKGAIISRLKKLGHLS